MNYGAMKKDEKFFFAMCYITRETRVPYDLLSVPTVKEIPLKKLDYYLRKWTDLGFYDYGTNLFFGWFYEDKIPERYKKVLAELELIRWEEI